MKRNKYGVLLANTAIFAIGNILVKIISFLLMPLYTSVLTTYQYGVAELLNNAIEIILPIATLSIIEAIYRFSIGEGEHTKIFTNGFLIVFFGDLAVILVSMLVFCVVGYEYIVQFCILYITSSFYKLTTQFARGLGHVKRYVAYGVFNSVLLIVSNVVFLVWLRGGVSAYILSFSMGYGVSGIIAFVMSREYKFLHWGSRDRSVLKSMLRYSLPNVPNLVSWWVNSLSDRYILLAFWGANIAGIYTAASKLPAMINLITSIFQQAWQYSTAVEIKSADSTRFFSNVFRVYSYVVVCTCAVLLVLNRAICTLLLKQEFFEAWKYTPMLLVAAGCGCISTYFGTFYNALKDNKMLMISTLVGAITNIILNFFLIPVAGGIGASFATLVSYAIIMAIRMKNIIGIINLEIDVGKFWTQIFVLGIATLISCIEVKFGNLLVIGCSIVLVMSDVKIFKELYESTSSIFLALWSGKKEPGKKFRR